MDYTAILDQVLALLQQERRLAYRVLKLRLQLDDDTLEALKEDLIYAKKLAVDEAGKVLVWMGDTGSPSGYGPTPTQPPKPQADQSPQVNSLPSEPRVPEAERRQLTVLFCDLVDSTALASRLDPEDWREVVRAYQGTCAKVIGRFEGHIAQYLGDGLLVYFGYPMAHEDDAQRAVRAGLGMVEAVGQLNTRLHSERGVSLAVRLGIHTGQVVVGEIGGGAKHEQLALGETPNVAARLQGLAGPDTVVISAATYRLIVGYFECREWDFQALKGVAQPMATYQVLHESTARSRLDVAAAGLIPLVGRDTEMERLLARWREAEVGHGRVVLLSGEAGIGKSRLVRSLAGHVAQAPQAWLTACLCSPYYRHTALHPLVDVLERVVLKFGREDSSEQKLCKLEGWLVQYGLPLPEMVPLFASLLSVPLGERYPPLTLSPERQKRRTMESLLQILLVIAAQQPVLFLMEDLHWADPTSLEWLDLLIQQVPTARILVLLSYRPDFNPPSPWIDSPLVTLLTLNRLTRDASMEIVRYVAGGKAVPAEMLEQVVARTDGVPLFVEELTKTVLESGLLRETEGGYELTGPLPSVSIPATLQDSLMARLDRLSPIKGVAQLGAMLGREFSYEVLQAVSPLEEATLLQALAQLVEAALLYQRGVPPQATYLFKHTLIQETAYQTLLKSTRQQYHQRVARVLAERFQDMTATRPELLAHHYTEAGLTQQGIEYWQRAGQRAIERSANLEAIAHLTKALTLLGTLPDTPEHMQQELTLHAALSVPLMATKGAAAPEVERTYTRARDLCQQLGETPELFPMLYGQWLFYLVRAQLETARELGERLLSLAQRAQDATLLLEAHRALGTSLFYLGELTRAGAHLEQAMTLYDPQEHRSLAYRFGQDPGVVCRGFAAWALGVLGYPDRALRRSDEARTMAQELAHPFTLAYALDFAARIHQLRRDGGSTRQWAEALLTLSRAHGFTQRLATGMVLSGWGLTAQGRRAAGVSQVCQGLDAFRATGAELARPYYLSLLAEAYEALGQAEKGLATVAEALASVQATEERFCEAELYRLKGMLLLASSEEHPAEAEACFRRALAIAQTQKAKAWELRAATSLSRLWQRQGRRADARELLAPIYGWFTEGFDTPDLQEAKALLDE